MTQLQNANPVAVSSPSAPLNVASLAVLNTSSPELTTTTFSTLADLKDLSLPLYNAMMKGIAMMLVNQMQNRNNQLIKLIREGKR